MQERACLILVPLANVIVHIFTHTGTQCTLKTMLTVVTLDRVATAVQDLTDV